MTEPMTWGAQADESARRFGLKAEDIKREGEREVASLLADKIIVNTIKDWEASVSKWSADILKAGGGPSLDALVPVIKQELAKRVAKDMAARVIPTINNLDWQVLRPR